MASCWSGCANIWFISSQLIMRILGNLLAAHQRLVSVLSVSRRLKAIMKCCKNKIIIFHIKEQQCLFFGSDSKVVQWSISDLLGNFFFFLTHREYFCFQLSSSDHITLRRSQIAGDIIYKLIQSAEGLQSKCRFPGKILQNFPTSVRHHLSAKPLILQTLLFCLPQQCDSS